MLMEASTKNEDIIGVCDAQPPRRCISSIKRRITEGRIDTERRRWCRLGLEIRLRSQQPLKSSRLYLKKYVTNGFSLNQPHVVVGRIDQTILVYHMVLSFVDYQNQVHKKFVKIHVHAVGPRAR